MNRQSGLTLIETVVGLGVLGIVAFGTYQALWAVQAVVGQSHATIVAVALVNERMEYIRSLPYTDVGIEGGFPSGGIPQEETIERSGWIFEVLTTIRNIDDPAFGEEGAANYKLVQIDIACDNCRRFVPVSVTTYVAPLGLEDSSGGGLFIQVFNASGLPLAGAQVRIENSQADPPFIIEDTTNNDGILRIIGLPEGTEAYEITVYGNNYSTDRTYDEDEIEGESTPLKPHATIVEGQVTPVSFAIDELSTFNVQTRTDACAISGDIPFTLFGSKKIGIDPDVLKYSEDHQTDAAGNISLSSMEWDDYFSQILGTQASLVGTIPPLPLSLAPNHEETITLVVTSQDSDALLVVATDAVTGDPLSGAVVSVTGSNEVYEWVTGETSRTEEIWENQEGQIFDAGADATFSQIVWDPEDQEDPDNVRIQFASSSLSDGPWNYLGPDGTPDTYYTQPSQNIASVHNGDRYFRMILSEESGNASNVSVTFSSECVPPGQAYFEGLEGGSYTVLISHEEYEDIQDIVEISNTWQRYDTALQPN